MLVFVAARLQVVLHLAFGHCCLLEVGAEELLRQTDVLGVLNYEVLFDALYDVAIYLAAWVVALIPAHHDRVVLDCQVIDHDAALLNAARVLERCFRQCILLRVWLRVKVFVDLDSVIVQISFQLAKVTYFLLVIVSLTHTGMSF